MTAAERLRAMSRGHGHCVVPRGVLRDIAASVDRELAEAAKLLACEYVPDETYTYWDDDDEEVETGLAYPGCDACHCSLCGYEMMAGECGWFDEEKQECGGHLMVPRFRYCPNCGAEVVSGG